MSEKKSVPVFDHPDNPEYPFGMEDDNIIKTLRLAAGLTQAELAKAANTSQAQIFKLENNVRELTKPWAERLAAPLKTSVEHLLGLDKPVRVVGYVGAGGQAYYSEGQGELGEAPRPPGFSSGGIALVVRGDSMPGVADDGSLIYYEKRTDPPTDDLIGSICVVGLEDGSVLVKRIYRGSIPGRFDLVSTALGPMKDQNVLWAAKVDWIKPR